MVRPCFLVIDNEFSGSISTRKLVIETAKFNVLTAYGAQEAIDTLAVFPNVSGVVLNAGMHNMHCTDLIGQLRVLVPKLPVVVINPQQAIACVGANHELDSFDPGSLLELLRSLVPASTAVIDERDEQLRSEGL